MIGEPLVRYLMMDVHRVEERYENIDVQEGDHGAISLLIAKLVDQLHGDRALTRARW